MSISHADKAPDVVNLFIEIASGNLNKYEMDKDSGKIMLDRVNGTAMGYPTDYGYVPDTLCDDGDPLDGLLIIRESVPSGIVVPARAIGVLNMVDDGEGDEKLILVPADDIHSEYIKSVDDLGPNFKKMIEHFYSHYKDWKNDWKGVEISFNGWGGPEEAKKVIEESIARAK